MLKSYFSVFLVLFAIAGVMFSPQAFGDVTTPMKQKALGIANEDVICKQGYWKSTKVSNGDSICIKFSSVMLLVEKGVIEPVNVDALEKAQKREKLVVGTVEKVALVKDPEKVKYGTIDRSSYHYTFKVCAKDNGIYAPEVIVESDSATKKAKLPNRIAPNKCELSVVKIIATNPDSITADLTNKGRITATIVGYEKTIAGLKDEIKQSTTTLDMLTKDRPEGYKKEMTKIIQNISDKRLELTATKEKMNRFLYALHTKTTTKLSELDVPKLAGGKILEGLTVEKLEVTEQEVNPGIFNVPFEVCTGKDHVKAPVVVVTSDTETKKINLSNRIEANTCQTSGAKISAGSAENIEVSLGGSSDRTLIISELETQIADLQSQSNELKAGFEKFLVKTPKPADFDEQASDTAKKIEDLRKQINTAKAKLYQYLTQIHE